MPVNISIVIEERDAALLGFAVAPGQRLTGIKVEARGAGMVSDEERKMANRIMDLLVATGEEMIREAGGNQMLRRGNLGQGGRR